MRRVVTLVTKQGCHTCDDVLKTLASLCLRYDLELKVLDIRDDRKLHDKYWLTIPVVQLEGKDVFDAVEMSRGVDYSRRLEELLR